MTPGFYVLTCDVPNPHPDRRMRRDWRALPVLPAGLRVEVSTRNEFQPARLTYVDGAGCARYEREFLRLDAPLSLALAPHLVPCDLSHAQWLRVTLPDSTRWVLERLLDNGTVTRAQIAALAEDE